MDIIRKIIKNFLFPAISETEVLTAFYLAIIFLINSIANTKPQQLLGYLLTKDSFVLILALISVILSIHKIIKDRKPIDTAWKSLVATEFYFITVTASLIYAYETLEHFTTQYIIAYDWINLFILFYVFTRTFFSFVFLIAMIKLDKMDFFTDRITDEQGSRIDFFIIFFLALFLYLFLLLSGYSKAATIVLSYFYTTVLINLLRKLKITPNN